MEKSEHERLAKERNPDFVEQKVIPVAREEISIGKRRVETGLTRVTKRVRERVEVVDEPTLQDEVHIDRVPVNRYLKRPVSVRQEGDVTIVPVMEEVLFVEKRLLLKEELHIRKRVKAVRNPQKVVLRGEEAVVEHVDLRDRG